MKDSIKSYENLAKSYTQRKRMKKLAGIKESTSGVRPAVREGISLLAANIKNLADELRRRK